MFKIGELSSFFFGNDGLFGEYEIRIFKLILINCKKKNFTIGMLMPTVS